MLLINQILTNFHPTLLIEQLGIITMLTITVGFFLVLLILGVRKSYKLKAENERLSKKKTLQSDEEDKAYKDFTEGHLYDNK